jgi:hypothetical protein
MSLIGRLANSVGVNLVEARIQPVAVIVVLEKSQCDSRKIEIKIAAHLPFRFLALLYVQSRPVNGARRGCHVRAIGGDRAIGGHTPTNRHSFIAGARSADNFHAQAPLGRALGFVPSRGENLKESHDPSEVSKINASPRVSEGVFDHSGCDCSQ